MGTLCVLVLVAIFSIYAKMLHNGGLESTLWGTSVGCVCSVMWLCMGVCVCVCAQLR